MKRIETLAVAVTTLGLLAAAGGPIAYERARQRQAAARVDRVIRLTGVAATGTWTEARVDASNYWRSDFPAAAPVVCVGERVLLQLLSVDVRHGFYAPELGVGPVAVEPGQVHEVEFVARAPGVFTFYCTTVCAHCHYYMRGVIRVVEQPGQEPPLPVPAVCPDHAAAPAAGPRLVQQGAWLFANLGCAACHGAGGRGGVANPNYVRGTVPSLHDMAERLLHLEDPEDVQAFVARLEAGPLALAPDPGIPGWRVVVAQYESTVAMIRNGSPPARKDPTGPDQPLQMPAWRFLLSDRQIDSLIAYLASLSVQ